AHVLLGSAALGFLFPLPEVFFLFPVAAAADEDFLVSLAEKLHLLVTVGAAGVGLPAHRPAIAAFPILADQHFAVLALDGQELFPALRADLVGQVIVVVLGVAVLHVLHQLG